MTSQKENAGYLGRKVAIKSFDGEKLGWVTEVLDRGKVRIAVATADGRGQTPARRVGRVINTID